MSVYARFKRDQDGFRKLVELLESTPASRRQKMIDVGMEEDAEYTQKALQFVMDFHDIIDLPDLELAEVCAKAPARMIAYAISPLSTEIRERFLRACKPKVFAEVRDMLEVKIGQREIGGAQLKVIESARELERAGYVKTKRIPMGGAVPETEPGSEGQSVLYTDSFGVPSDDTSEDSEN
jgi:flagellar motor switch protein FliG